MLIDELEQHLHPQWQRLIVANLRKQLPKVQFVLTTHSPLIASAVTGLDDQGWREKLFYFGVNEDKKIVPTESALLRGMNPQQVLASAAFDYIIDADPSVEAVYAESSRLAPKGNKRSPEEEKRYKRAKQLVGEMLQNQDTTLIEQEARKDLVKQNEEKLKELKAAVFGKLKQE